MLVSQESSQSRINASLPVAFLFPILPAETEIAGRPETEQTSYTAPADANRTPNEPPEKCVLSGGIWKEEKKVESCRAGFPGQQEKVERDWREWWSNC